jgi:hypothetical protein
MEPETLLKIHGIRYKVIAPNAKLSIFDLAGYGRQPLMSEK